MLFNLKSFVITAALMQALLVAADPVSKPDANFGYNNQKDSHSAVALDVNSTEQSKPSSIVYSTNTTENFTDTLFLPSTLKTQTIGLNSVSFVATTHHKAVLTTASVETTHTTSSIEGSVVDSATHTGVATFYSVGADNCGTSSTDNDFVCAISQQLYNSVANSQSISEYCGHMINITYNGKNIQVKVVDSCPECDANHLDLSPAAFKSLADEDLGIIDIQWTWA